MSKTRCKTVLCKRLKFGENHVNCSQKEYCEDYEAPDVFTNNDNLKLKTPTEFAEFMKNRGCPPEWDRDDKCKCPPKVTCYDCWLSWLKERCIE